MRHLKLESVAALFSHPLVLEAQKMSYGSSFAKMRLRENGFLSRRSNVLSKVLVAQAVIPVLER